MDVCTPRPWYPKLVLTILLVSLAHAQDLPDAPEPQTITPYLSPILLENSTYSYDPPPAPPEGFVRNVPIVPRHTQWSKVAEQSSYFLTAQHLFRLLQPKTRKMLGGPFFADYVDSVEGIHGWGDGDGPITNYLMHPGEGAVSSFIYLQNSPARQLEFDPGSGEYWRSRLKGMAFAAVYSTQFEIGPYSEASIGNVGKRPGTSGYVDFVMTPVGGFALTVAEDAVDRQWIRPMENNPNRGAMRIRIARSLMNPNRAIANLLRGKAPWFRDSRPMPHRRLD